MSLLTVPPEIILQIAESQLSGGDINALLQCNRYLYRLLIKFLYLHQDRGKLSAGFWAVDNYHLPTLRLLKDAGIALKDCAGALLHYAAQRGYLEAVEYILDTGEIDIESIPTDDDVGTPLIEAARAGETQAVKMLLDRGANPSSSGPPGSHSYPLIEATYSFSEDIVKLLLAAGADVNSRDHNGNAAISIASRSGMLNIMTLLLDADADLHFSNTGGKSLLQWAAWRNGSQSAVEMLLNRGALGEGENPNALLRCAVIAGWDRVGEMLIERGADASYRVTGASTSLLMEAIECMHFDVALMLVQNGADVNAATVHGCTALHLACRAQCISFVEVLLAAGAEVSATDSDGEQPLQTTKCAEIVEILLAHGVDYRHVNNSGMSALTTAISEQRPRIAKLLLEAGAEFDAKDCMDVVRMACGSRTPYLVDLLIKHGPAVSATDDYASTALHQAAAFGYSSVAESLVQRGADVDPSSESGLTPLMRAAQYGQAETIKVLCRLGAGLEKTNSSGYTALLIAAAEGHVSAVDALLVHGAHAHATTQLGRTALLVSAEANGCLAVLERILQDDRTDVDAQDVHGRTALLHAAMRGHVDAVMCLLAHDPPADASIKDHWGTTPLSMAVRHGRTWMAQMLLASEQGDRATSRRGGIALGDPDRHGRTILDWARCTDNGAMWRLLAATTTRGAAGHDFIEDTDRVFGRFEATACYCGVCGRTALCRSGAAVRFCKPCEDSGRGVVFFVCRFCIEDGVACGAGHDTSWGEMACFCDWQEEQQVQRMEREGYDNDDDDDWASGGWPAMGSDVDPDEWEQGGDESDEDDDA